MTRKIMTGRRLKMKSMAAALVAVSTLSLAACNDSKPSSASSAQKRQNAASGAISEKFTKAVPYPYLYETPTDPLEMKNLARRLKQFNSKGSTGYVYLYAGMTDKVIGYYVINGKVSSTGSQMTSTQINVNCSGLNDSGGQACTVDAPGDDGSYGPSEGGSNGVFFFTTNGTLIETVQPWVYSSTPIKLYSSVPQLDAKASS